jgi:pyridoxal phosphate-dependent aminotransferase EpsN
MTDRLKKEEDTMLGTPSSLRESAPTRRLNRLYLSPPHMGDEELRLVQDAFASNWIAPLGPHVDAFERELAARVQVGHAAALVSGTSAIHLALKLLGVGPGDDVICSTLTFSASANPIVYQGANPVFIDAEPSTWNIDPQLLRAELQEACRRGKLPKAAIIVDLYGQCADYEGVRTICGEFEVPIVEDAAEALGATYRGKPAGGFGKFGVFSFNGNKIITASGGGMLVSDDEQLIVKARFLASQARDPAPHYQHSQLGFNYRMSNVLAAIGRGQLRVLDQRVAARRRVCEYYREHLGSLPGIKLMPEADYGQSNRWLTCVTIDPTEFRASREDVRLALEEENIESRPVWKPLHMQPFFSAYRHHGGQVAEQLFEHGLCLPSGSSMTTDDLDHVCRIVWKTHMRKG